MADDPQQKTQGQSQSGVKPDGTNGTNGHHAAQYPAPKNGAEVKNGVEVLHEGNKYADKEGRAEKR